jgi:hypothetical protein
VIGVAVGEEDRIEAIDAGAQALLAKIRGGVNDDVLAVAREEQGRAQPVVMRVLRAADAAVASERGNAHGRAGAEYGDF